MQVLKFLVLVLCYRGIVANDSFVATSTTTPGHGTSTKTNKTDTKLQMFNFIVESDVKYRYAKTLVSTQVGNPANFSQEAYFSVVLPETAFISGFLMEVDGKSYKAYIKEKEEAKDVYEKAVKHGRTAAHVALTARDSNRFTVSVNLEPQKNVTFNLTYEELLSRRLGVYREVINLDPGQIVPELNVTVRIEESSNITVLKVPALKEKTELDHKADTPNPLAKIERPTSRTAVIKFAPTPEQQKELSSKGVKGQLIVQYDIDRSQNPGEVLVNEGYFVHFFSPSDLKPLNKHVTFVLDLSGSMSGRKIVQLKQALVTILDDLNKGDWFSMVLFSTNAQVWDPTISDEEMMKRLKIVGRYSSQSDEPTPVTTPSVIARVTPENIAKAKSCVEKFRPTSMTNIYDALLMAMDISKLNTTGIVQDGEHKPEPIVVFLTDGLPNIHVSNRDKIVDQVTKANTKKCSIFSLALGDDADMDFLKKLSLLNSGFARKIYEAADTAIQLTDFYREIDSPLLANVVFKYTPDQIENGTVTKSKFQNLFGGSELVVAGKLSENSTLTGTVQANSSTGTTEFKFKPIPIPHPQCPLVPDSEQAPSFMERMWAYLTIQQLLEEDQEKNYKKKTSPEKQQALEIALKYSFVTPLTSLVVVKPNSTRAVDTVDASKAPALGIHAKSLSGSHKRNRRHQKHKHIVDEFSFLTDEEPTKKTKSTPFNSASAHICRATLKDITWLSDNRTVTLPMGANKTVQVLNIASENEIDSVYTLCKTPDGQRGHCRHLTFCVLDTFTTKRENFMPYFCSINSYVGVCCPDNRPRVCHP